jgi:hypothetical protein
MHQATSAPISPYVAESPPVDVMSRQPSPRTITRKLPIFLETADYALALRSRKHHGLKVLVAPWLPNAVSSVREGFLPIVALFTMPLMGTAGCSQASDFWWYAPMPMSSLRL